MGLCYVQQVTRPEKLIPLILGGRSDANIAFNDVRNLLLHFGFSERVRGSHHIYFREGIEEILNLQPLGAKAKPYQVKQVRSIIVKYKLGTPDE